MYRLHVLYERIVQYIGHIDLCVLRMLTIGNILANLKKVTSSDEFVDGTHSELRHDLTKVFCDELHEVHHVLRLSGKTLSENRVLGSYTYRTGILVADTHHYTSHSDKWCRSKSVFLSTEHCCYGYVAACHQLTVSLDDHFFTKTVSDEGLMSLGNSELPRHSGIVDR